MNEFILYTYVRVYDEKIEITCTSSHRIIFLGKFLYAYINNIKQKTTVSILFVYLYVTLRTSFYLFKALFY